MVAKMNTQKQGHTEQKTPKSAGVRPRPKQIVGMDAHTRKLAISIWEWSDDPWNPTFVGQVKCFSIDQLKEVYEKRVDLDSITIIEASMNSAMIKEMLDEIGFRAEVVRADIIADKERKRKVCDIKDAENLAKAYMKGDVEDFVWTATGKFAKYRAVFCAYRDARKEMQRNWNRVWSLCCACGIRLPEETGRDFLKLVRGTLRGLSLDEITSERFEMGLADYEKYLERSERLDGMILEIVRDEDDMIDLMQLPGFYYMSAFAVKTIVEDARRFSKGSKLSAYSGLAPQVNTSGEEEKRAEKKGGSGKPLDTEGRRDLKYYFCEAGQTVLNTCGKSALGKWGYHLMFKGKERNKVVCGVARKLSVYSWHVMRGDPTPNREGEALFRRKMIRFATDIGKNRLRELGYKSRSEFADRHVQRLYGALPKESEDKAKN